jgi:hypothetical protein
LVLGSWFLVLGSWFLVLGSWFLVLGSWFLVLGSWFLVLGSWFLIVDVVPEHRFITPIVKRKNQRAQKAWPTRFRFVAPDPRAPWMALFA